MSIRKNTWNLSGHYDLTNSGLNSYVGENQIFFWGINNYGHLGVNDRVARSSPVQLPGTQWSSSSSSLLQSLATKSDGTLWSFGLDQFGQQGQNTQGISRSSPTQIPGTQWSTGRNKISAGNHPNGAIKTDGTLWMWGYNDGGDLGQNSVVRYSSPVQVPGTQWNSISLAKPTTGGAVIATKTDGTLWGWGGNYNGGLGQNEGTANYSSPRQIPGTQWSLALSTYNGFRATKTDGTLWVCGSNTLGQLGQNNLVTYSSPIQVPGTQWDLTTSSVDKEMNILRKTDGTLWTFGENAYGGLGLNSTILRSSPTQIPGTQWAIASTHVYGGTAVKTDNTLWLWGYAYHGNLGQNNVIYRSSPVQIPGTQWGYKLPDACGFSPSAFILQ
jgi:alpha-tubulin suppressor-like RCC1 family protein